jgi:hypothetical protein
MHWSTPREFGSVVVHWRVNAGKVTSQFLKYG